MVSRFLNRLMCFLFSGLRAQSRQWEMNIEEKLLDTRDNLQLVFEFIGLTHLSIEMAEHRKLTEEEEDSSTAACECYHQVTLSIIKRPFSPKVFMAGDCHQVPLFALVCKFVGQLVILGEFCSMI